jgi:[NiFe] hydrogenase diaphorase moiety large subunit
MGEYRLKKVDHIFSAENDWAKTLKDSLNSENKDIIESLKNSELKGRGGAGYPTGLKWELASKIDSDEKYVICNADEGEPGTFKDREILSKVPFKVLTAMAICGKVIGAKNGYIYLRGEYAYLLPELNISVTEFETECKKLGFTFTIQIYLGGGAYICGEETALFESMEGHRGEPRNKPPFPTSYGFRGKPTVINNVETLAHAFTIFKYGASMFYELGVQYSRGSKVFSISGDTPKPGIYELELGMSLHDFVEEFGDGDTKAVQVGGASGFLVPRKKFSQTEIGFKGKLTGISLPTGGSMILFNSSRSMYNVLSNYLEFFREESCGQCTPCRVGCQVLINGIEEVKRGDRDENYLEKLLKLTETMHVTAKCGLGQSVANSFSSIVENFREEMIY